MICLISPCTFTGGPLAIHQAAAKIKAHGGDVGIMYLKNRKRQQAFEANGNQITSTISFLNRLKINDQLKTFGFPTRETFSINDHFIVPETMPAIAYQLLRVGCKNVSIWWLSVDNFPLGELHTLQTQRLLRDCTHFCQSEYAANFVRRHGASAVLMLSDEIDLSINKRLPSTQERANDLCFLPNKATGADQLLECLSEKFSLIRLENMSRRQITETLLNTKIFLDLGHHPGKDRVPREAALCGAIPVIRAEGAACFEQDVPLPTALLVETEAYFNGPKFVSRLQEILNKADEYNDILAAYRIKIKQEKEIFTSEIQTLIQADKGAAAQE